MRRRRPFRFFWEDEDWEPWNEIEKVSGGYFSGIPTDMSENDEEIIIKANLPGFDKKDVSLRIMDNRIIIEAEKNKEEVEEKKNYFRQERRCGKFYRELTLPVEVDEENIEAEMKDGVLKVNLPKKEKKKMKGKKIKLK